jgi:uncharacterized protein
MVSTREEALDLAARTRMELEKIYGSRLRGIYLYGSAARDELNEDSDIDIAIILDEISSTSDEHDQTSPLGSRLGLEQDTLISFFLTTEADFDRGRFAIHRIIKKEGIMA